MSHPQMFPALGANDALNHGAELHEALHRYLCAQVAPLLAPGEANAGLCRYALVSAGQCNEGVVAAAVRDHRLPDERLFMQTPESDMADIGPWLIELPSTPGPELLDALADMATSQSMTLLCSALRIPKLAEHLRSFMSGVLPDGSPVLLRWFDPRIGFDMLVHWPDAVRQRFLAPLAWWAGWDGGFEFRRFSGAASGDGSSSSESIELDTRWLKAVDEVGEPQLIVALLLEEMEAAGSPALLDLSRMHAWLRRQVARDALVFARGAGLFGWDDRLLACRLALTTHPKFYEHPAFGSVWSATAPTRLVDVLAKLPARVHAGWAQDRQPALARLCEELKVALGAVN
ncbi:DUF4123 domain-containing protein [Variovorax sp. J22G73]|uniref:DUF4123 domain-containing protein n=1 Tax=unclassified Variovorax TaxID=663243 RepID=UPI000D5CEB1B|nr:MULTISPECIES: DUF4123 domain-containing protein [unclassified Variovorax]MDM0009549.1 DUF4123 domain-containing protein [Variovorax sp. J22R203]MDM0102057.1 DUF4123 domain-containing protein [Variovorax sp. J22G73]